MHDVTTRDGPRKRRNPSEPEPRDRRPVREPPDDRPPVEPPGDDPPPVGDPPVRRREEKKVEVHS